VIPALSGVCPFAKFRILAPLLPFSFERRTDSADETTRAVHLARQELPGCTKSDALAGASVIMHTAAACSSKDMLVCNVMNSMLVYRQTAECSVR
jgi:hypothetical protein